MFKSNTFESVGFFVENFSVKTRYFIRIPF